MKAPKISGILDEFACSTRCSYCLGSGLVCADHPSKAWLDGTCCAASYTCCPLIIARFKKSVLP